MRRDRGQDEEVRGEGGFIERCQVATGEERERREVRGEVYNSS